MSTGTHAGLFLIQTLFNLYLTVLLVRMLLQAVRADYFNPISQAIVKLTNPLLTPLRSVIPNRGRMDWGALLVLLVLQAIKLMLMLAIVGQAFSPLPLLIQTVVESIRLVFNTLFYAIIIRAVLSFVDPYGQNPLARVLTQITEPLLGPARQVIPPIGGLDLSPLVVLIGMQLLMILLGL